MKQFIQHITMFLSITVLLYLLPQLLPFFVTSFDPGCYQVEKLWNANRFNQVAVYGDSKNFVNFYRPMMESHFGTSLYNYAIWGGNIEDSDLIYGDAFLNAEQLNIINLHEVSYGREPEISNKFNFLVAQITPHSLQIRNPSEYYYKDGFMQLSGNTYANLDTFDLGEGRGLERAQPNLFHKNARLLKQHIQRQGAKMLFVIHPDRKLRTTYLNKLYGPGFIDQIYEQYFSEYPLIDLRKFTDLSNPTFYYDDHHMNEVGSKLLTKYFLQECEKLTPRIFSSK